MVRKASGSKGRGIRQGLQRHKIQANKSDGQVPAAAIISTAAKTTKEYVTRVCILFCLIPIVQSSPSSVRGHQQYQLAPLWKRTVHYLLMSFYMFFTVYKLTVTVYLVLCTELNATVFMCFCSLLVLLIPCIIAATTTSWYPLETLHLLASCHSMGDSLYEFTGKSIQVHNSVSFCLKWIAMAFLTHCAAMNAAAFSLVFDNLPVCVFPIVNWLGLIPKESSSLSPIFWQIGFYPLELLTLLPLMIVAAFIFHTFLLGMATLKFVADHIRIIDLVDEESWTKVERLYNCIRLHNIIYLNWMRYFTAPVIFLWGTGVTVLLYITFRPYGLPVLVYCWLPLLAVNSMFIVTWQFYDAVVAKRSTDEVLSKLQSRTTGYYRTLFQRGEKTKFMRRCRALQPVRLPIGEFTEFTLEVAMNIWEEVFNQLLFLLSL